MLSYIGKCSLRVGWDLYDVIGQWDLFPVAGLAEGLDLHFLQRIANDAFFRPGEMQNSVFHQRTPEAGRYFSGGLSAISLDDGGEQHSTACECVVNGTPGANSAKQIVLKFLLEFSGVTEKTCKMSGFIEMDASQTESGVSVGFRTGEPRWVLLYAAFRIGNI